LNINIIPKTNNFVSIVRWAEKLHIESSEWQNICSWDKITRNRDKWSIHLHWIS